MTYIQHTATWDAGNSMCSESNGNMVKLSSEEDNQDMRDIVGRDSTSAVWIGASNTGGSWKWMDGTPLPWAPPEVDWTKAYDGTVMAYAEGNWIPTSPSASLFYMCAVKIKLCDAAVDKV